MAFLKKSAQAPFIGLAALVLGVAVPLLFVQEAPRDAVQSICGIGVVLTGIAMLLRLAAPQREATAPRQAASGAAQILLGCALLSSHGGARLGLLAGGLLVLAFTFSGRMERWLGASE